MSVRGRDHLEYVQWLGKGDFEVAIDVPDDSSQKEIDQAFDEATVNEAFRLLEVHKENCSNCTIPMLEKTKGFLRSKGWKG